MSTALVVVLIIVGLLVLMLVAVVANFFMLWLQALTSGARVTFWSLIGTGVFDDIDRATECRSGWDNPRPEPPVQSP